MIYPGHIIATIRAWARADQEANPCQSPITVDGHQGNGLYGIHQARVTMQGDPTTYRLIIAPADAPITINGRPIGEHFAQPLGER